ncbi:MAG: hypothetical protein ACI82A_001694 [Candidatus Azotimanducaceae bacterium]|jgi:hypothetical protein
MSKLTDLYARPNRRTQGQRRQGKTERRQKSIWVSNCRRSNCLKTNGLEINNIDRRSKDDRRPTNYSSWQSLKTIKPLKHRFQILEGVTNKGSLINISV